ncbi:hypothetical protein A2673_03350 [Candidatus Kaiserbacteria bacterium RIFCSPHIGHO2_01_FULL_50_13]|uniref:DoxX family protein n=1 Tax=Candidatus Kaiserbacteria bacterium RIFCSPLOWO2_01_FULL_50_24 TaxID=1798507 RepID=A0A1F6EIT4_9BACT|nr:MAG: hypothetical protein A2673_03350 [Candidatus Kaiserbacteria bacterium RIFCSPHIGHO2_01_FULL_50_13]OGG73539.1 MAG: hypothetical protein A3A34_01190 [Candidatus Kaiserbacteria bacterium RIFCSPLOWO2_01_FULL_50_24]OGG81587.1 MAG: hypothetical protein A3H74_00725 [Candidatus Kaiserbacteria bacterium RIFCSPLOWO2_02_FULL_51_13]
MIHNGRVIDWLLRVGLAFSLLYPPIAAYFDPFSWIGYFPAFTRGVMPDETLLIVFGAVEIALALWLLSGWRVHIPAMLAAVLLLAIAVFNLGQFPVLFRDISIAVMAVALAIIHWPRAK